jgi:hypothetical protein
MLLVKMRTLKSAGMQWMRQHRHCSLPGLAVAVAASLAVAFGLTACVNVASYTQPSLVRVIDASYIAPAANVVVEGVLIASNIGQGTITDYATVPANNAATIKITEATGGASLVSTDGTILAGYHHSVFLTDNGAASTGYTVTILKDQQVAAAGGHSAFRFLNQAPKVGAVDVYMIPASTTLANTTALVSDLAVGSTAGYVSFPSQTVTMVIVPTGLTSPKYTSASLSLTGGEVRTVLIVDTQLTSDPPVAVYTAKDVN